MQTETGLSFLSRICGRNKELSLGPGLPPLSSLVTRLESHGHHKDSLDLITALVTDITARLTLETSVILIDCSHKFNIKKLSRLLGDRVRKQAEEESKKMKDAGLSREEREKSRMTSYKQWEEVRNALSRLFILHVHTPDCLETSILNLNDIITANYNVSAVIVLGVNTFYHQLHKEEGINYFNYTKRMRSLIEESCSDYKDSVKILMVELNIFGDKTDSEDQIAAKKPSMVIVENSSNGLSVHFQGRSAAISLDNNNMITWN